MKIHFSSYLITESKIRKLIFTVRASCIKFITNRRRSLRYKQLYGSTYIHYTKLNEDFNWRNILSNSFQEGVSFLVQLMTALYSQFKERNIFNVNYVLKELFVAVILVLTLLHANFMNNSSIVLRNKVHTYNSKK